MEIDNFWYFYVNIRETSLRNQVFKERMKERKKENH